MKIQLLQEGLCRLGRGLNPTDHHPLATQTLTLVPVTRMRLRHQSLNAPNLVRSCKIVVLKNQKAVET